VKQSPVTLELSLKVMLPIDGTTGKYQPLVLNTDMPGPFGMIGFPVDFFDR
jgi:hypothetical protein